MYFCYDVADKVSFMYYAMLLGTSSQLLGIYFGDVKTPDT